MRVKLGTVPRELAQEKGVNHSWGNQMADHVPMLV